MMESLRRATSLVAFWRDQQLIVENYLARASYELPVEALAVLSAFDDYRTPVEVSEEFGDFDPESVLEAVSVLRECGLLLRKEEAVADEALDDAWREWPHDARYFHFSTKDAPYIEARADEAEMLNDVLSGPQPAITKRPGDGPRIFLPRDFVQLTGGFYETLVGRRTHRRFLPEAVGLREFSTLLHLAFGPMQFVDAGVFGTLMMKNFAAAGARHELEHYLAVFDVAGVEPGLYHYDPLNHSLEVVDVAITPQIVVNLTYEQDFCGQGAFTVFTTAVIDRMMAKYRHPRAYRAILMNLGHQAQTFAMIATALGLGPFQTAAIKDAEVEELLGVDGVTETAMYCMGAGVPELDGRGDAVDAAPPAGIDAWRRTTWL